MKTLKITILFLLLPLFVSGQIERYVYGSVSIDAVNIVKGSQPTNNKPEFDLNFDAGIHLGNNITWNFNFESFKAIGYSKLACGAGYIFEPMPKVRIHLVGLTELIFRRGSMVEQYFQYNDTFIGASINAKLLYNVVDNLYIGGCIGGQLRGDLKDAGYKDYIKINGAIVVEYLIYID
jgi:hypothetical protein